MGKFAKFVAACAAAVVGFVAWAGDLPSGFMRLGCLVSHGTEYIDTEVVPKSTTRVVLDFAFTEKPTADAFCGWGSSGGAEVFMFGASATGFCSCIDPAWKNRSYATDSAGTIIPMDLARHTFDVKSGSQKFDGFEYAKCTIGNTASDKQYLYLFATRIEWGKYDYKMKAKIYSCKIYDGDTLVRDLVPCLNAQNVLVMYDLVEGKEYANKGSGTFGFEYANGVLVVGSPAEYGVPDPAYGFCDSLDIGEAHSFVCPAVATNAAGTSRGNCAGWTLEFADGAVTSGDGNETSVTLTTANNFATLTWRWTPVRIKSAVTLSSVAAAARVITATYSVTALTGDGTTTRVTLEGAAGTGDVSYTDGGSAIVTATASNLKDLTWTAPVGYFNTCSLRLRVDQLDADGNVVATSRTAAKTVVPQDKATYTWRAVDGNWDGDFNDTAHWTCNQAEDRCPWPSNEFTTISFPANSRAQVRIPSNLSCGSITFNSGADITFSSVVGSVTNRLTAANLTTTSGSTLTLDTAALTDNRAFTPGAGSKIVLKNRSDFYDGNNFSLTAAGGKTQLLLSGKSTASVNHFYLGGGNLIVLDDSKLTIRNTQAYLGSGNPNGTIRFQGRNPQLYFSQNDCVVGANLGTAATSSNVNIDFLVPVGGYASTPITGTSNATKVFATPVAAANKGTVTVNVLAESPAAQVDEELNQTLISWVRGFDATYFLSGYAPRGAATVSVEAKEVKVAISGSTHKVEVTAEPEELGEPSTGYAGVTGLAAGEERTFTFPAYTNQMAGVACEATGWTVFAYDPATGDFTREIESGDGPTCAYVHPDPAVATRLVWHLSRSYYLTVNAAEGGTVDQPSQWVREGAFVDLTATDAAGWRFHSWTGTSNVRPRLAVQRQCRLWVSEPTEVTPRFGKPWYVSKDGNDSTGDGTSTKPFATLAKAHTAAENLDTILVRKGEYSLTANLAVSKGVAIAAENPNDGEAIFRPSTAISMFTLSHADARLENLVVEYIKDKAPKADGFLASVTKGGLVGCDIRNAVSLNCAQGSRSFVYLNGANAYAVRCRIRNNRVEGSEQADSSYAAALYLNGGATAEECLVAGNRFTGLSASYGAGAHVVNGTLIGCTIVGNTGWSAGGLYLAAGEAVDCVIAGNRTERKAFSYANVVPSHLSRLRNCIVEVNARPLFVDFGCGDYRPHPAGPLADAAIVTQPRQATDVEGRPRFSGAGADIGAFEFDQETFGVTLAASETRGIGPMDVTFVAAAGGVAVGDELAWDWTVDGASAGTTPTNALKVTLGPGSHAVSVTLRNMTTGKSASDAKADYVRLVGPTLFVKREYNFDAAWPYATWATAANSLADAMAAAEDGCRIELQAGQHTLSAVQQLFKAVVISGATDNPADTTLKTTASIRMFKLAHPGARLENLTLDHGFTGSGGDHRDYYRGSSVRIVETGGTVSNCVIRNVKQNSSNAQPAVYVWGADSLVTHCVITNNECGGHNSTDYVTGIYLDAAGRVENCLIADNRNTYGKTDQVGGVYLNGGTLANCTLVNNRGQGPGAVRAMAGRAVNCVICHNLSTESVAQGNIAVGSDKFFENCAFDDREVAGPGCLFREDWTSFFADALHGDWRLPRSSALVDAGADGATAAATDLGGSPRVSGGAVDIGAYEYDQDTFAVSIRAETTQAFAPAEVTLHAEAAGVPDGHELEYVWTVDGVVRAATSEASLVLPLALGSHAFAVTLTDKTTGASVSDAKADYVRIVPKLMYVATGNANAEFPYDTPEKGAADVRTAVAAMLPGGVVELTAGKHTLAGALELSKPVTVRGATAEPADTVLKTTAKIRMVTLAHADARLESLTVDHGSNGYSDSQKAGGASVRIEAAGGTVSNCVIRNVLLKDSVSCSAVAAYGSSSLVTHSVISNNVAGGHNNDVYAAGLILNDGARGENCLIVGNKATYGKDGQGGGVYLNGGVLANCTVLDNDALGVAGVRVAKGSIFNCVICNNRSTSDAAKNNIAPSTASSFSHCAFDGTEVAGTACVFALNWVDFFADAAHAVYTPTKASLLTDAGTDGAMSAATDLAGTSRVSGEAIDIGAYEYDFDSFAVSIRAETTEAFAPAEIVLHADTTGAPDGHQLEYVWTVDGEVLQATSESTLTLPLDSGLHSFAVTLTDRTADKSVEDAKADYVKVVPKVMYVVTGNAGAAFPYDTPENAAADVRTAVAETISDGVVELAAGTHTLAGALELSKPVTVRGATADPAETVLKTTSQIRMVTLAHADARLESLTVDHGGNGYSDSQKAGGASVRIEAAGGTVSNCVIRNVLLKGSVSCSAVAAYGSSSLVTHSVISNNVAGGHNNDVYAAGLILNDGARGENCLIIGNQGTYGVDGQGGGVYLNGGVLANCTVLDNDALGVAGVRVAKGSVLNCVVCNNRSTSDAAKNNLAPSTASSFSHCAFDGTEVAGTACVFTPNWVDFFADAAHAVYTPTKASLLTDAGTDGATSAATDLAGTARVSGEAIDIGAYEYDFDSFAVSIRAEATEAFAPAEIVLHADTTGAPDGHQLEYVWTVDGVAQPVASDSSLTLPLGAGLHSFAVTLTDTTAGTSVSDAKADYVKVVPKVMYVVTGNAGAAFPYDTPENAAADVRTAVAETISDGVVELAAGTHTLAGALELSKSVTVRGATADPADTVIKTTAKLRMVTLAHADARLESLTVDHGSNGYSDSQKAGGASIRIEAAGGTVSNCVIRNVKLDTDISCSAVAAYGSSSLVTHSVISNNVAGGHNNDVYAAGLILNSGARGENCLIVGNNATYGKDGQGGGVYLNGGVLANCTVLGNKALGVAGVRVAKGSVLNCVICNNFSSAGVDKNNIAPSTASSFSHCAFDGTEVAGTACVFTPNWVDFFADAAHAVYTPTKASLLTDAGTDGATSAATDLAGTARVSGEAIDIGAYEYDFDSFAVSIRAETTEAFAPAEIVLHADTTGAPDGHQLEYVWTVDGVAQPAISESSLTLPLDSGLHSFAVTLTDTTAGTSVSDAKADYVRVVPKVMYVVAGNTTAAFPYDTPASAASNVNDAVEATISDGVVELMEGTHVLKKTLELNKSVTVRGTAKNPEKTVLKARDNIQMVVLANVGARLENMVVDHGGNGYSSSVRHGGASVRIEAGGGTVSNCVIRNVLMKDTHTSSAVAAYGSDSLVTHCVISNNVGGGKNASAQAMGLVLADSARCENCLIIGNDANYQMTDQAGGVYLNGGILEHCTVVSNRALGVGGVRVASGSVLNSVVAGNVTSDGSLSNYTKDMDERFTRCAFDGPRSRGPECVVMGSFEATFLPRRMRRSAFVPKQGSVLIDKVPPTDAARTAVDLFGRPRLVGPRADIGAYEGGFGLLLMVR